MLQLPGEYDFQPPIMIDLDRVKVLISVSLAHHGIEVGAWNLNIAECYDSSCQLQQHEEQILSGTPEAVNTYKGGNSFFPML